MSKTVLITIIVVVLITIVGGIIYYFYGVNDIGKGNKNGIDNKANKGTDMLIGKNIYITISQNEKADYQAVLDPDPNKKFALWRQEEKEKLAEFMKINNYIIEPGSYVLNQAATFEKAREIFKFTENKE